MKENKTSLKSLLALTMIIVGISACSNEVTNTTKNSTNIIKQISNNTLINEVAKNEIIKPSLQEEEDIKNLIESSTDILALVPEDDQDTLEATVPNNGGVVFATVLNNGGVVFALDEETNTFSTKATLEDLKEKIDNPQKYINNGKASKSPTPLISNTPTTILDTTKDIKDQVINEIKEKVMKRVLDRKELPKEWGRKVIGKPTKEYKILFNPKTKDVEVILASTYDIEITIKKENKTITRNIKETKISKIIFEKINGKWSLSKLSPSTSNGSESTSSIEIKSAKVIVESRDKNGSATTKSYIFNNNEMINKDDVVKISKGDFITLEVNAIEKDNKSINNLLVFAKPSNIKVRVPLLDDGGQENPNAKSGDLTKDDSIFTTNLAINAKTKNYFLNITATTDGAILGDSNFSSATMSIPIKME